MRKPTSLIWAVVFTLAAWGSLAYADSMVANVPFPFKAAGKDFPAGKYLIDAGLPSEELTIRNEATGKAAILPYDGRLSERGDEALLVFDKQGDQHYLSEIYIPGLDGFELKAASGKHTHVKVKAGK